MAGVLENYAARGVFRGFSRGRASKTRATFKMLWHRGQTFEVILDTRRKTLRIPVVLPQVSAQMSAGLRQFVATRRSARLPAHRRIDAKKAAVSCARRGGNASVTIEVRDGDWEYGVRKLIGLVHEVYMVFLYDGPYYDYMVETFDLDPDRM